MSFVLDALRKSSPESIARGMPDPMGVERVRATGSRPWLIVLAVLAAGGAGAAAQLWSRHAGMVSTVQPVAVPPAAPVPVAALPAPAEIEPLALSRSMEKSASRPAPSKRGQGGKTASTASPQTAGHAELPVALRQQLPQLAIGGYILDKEAGSLAIIDGKVLRVGEEAAPGLRIEKIDTNGVTFNYQGHRFRR